MKRTPAQKLADMYASQGGREQLLIAVYQDDAVLYANVHRETALRITGKLAGVRAVIVDETAQSADGMTFAWTMHRSREHPGRGDWLPLVMIGVSNALRAAVPELLAPDESVMYVDNRERDANTVEAFAASLT